MKAYFLKFIVFLLGLLCGISLIIISITQKDYSECIAWVTVTIINIWFFKNK